MMLEEGNEGTDGMEAKVMETVESELGKLLERSRAFRPHASGWVGD